MKKRSVKNDYKSFAPSHWKTELSLTEGERTQVKPVWGDEQEFNLRLKFAERRT